MPKQKPTITITNYGLFTTWNKKSKEMPKLLNYTQTIEAVEGNEFGIIINVDFAKGKVLEFMIKHPPLKDKNGLLLPQFKGKLYVNSIHTRFFVGDGIWLPIDDKIGTWEVLIFLDGKEAVSKTFELVATK